MHVNEEFWNVFISHIRTRGSIGKGWYFISTRRVWKIL